MRKRTRRGVKDSRLPRKLGGRVEHESVVVSFFRALSENMGNILRLGLVVGGLWFFGQLPEVAEDLRAVTQGPDRPPASQTQEAPASDDNPVIRPKKNETFMTPGVEHYLNCTKAEYRRDNYDACFPEGDSEVYARDDAAEDDSSGLNNLLDRLYAYVQ